MPDLRAEAELERSSIWRMAHQYDREAVALADRHYSRVKVGSPKFMPPGRQLVLVASGGGALWACGWPFAEFVNRVYPGAWLNTHFRRESGGLASAMIVEALAVTRYIWGDPPADGIVTMIDRKKVRPTMVRGETVYGWTYRKVGFEEAGETVKKKHLILRLKPELVPPPIAPVVTQGTLW